MIFQYEFMRIAFLVGSFVAISIPFVGMIMVLKRMSMIGETLSHISIVGVILGLIFGFDPIFGAIAATLLATLSIESIRKRFNGYNELALTVVASAGIGLSGVLFGFVKTNANFESFLFGSILTISTTETVMAILLSIVVVLVSLVLYRQFFMITFDPQAAKLSKINVQSTNLIFTVMTAINVAVASRIVGAMIVSSLMVIPVAASMQISKNYRQTLLYSIIFSLVSVWFGLIASFYLPGGIKPGGAIVLSSIAVLLIVLGIKEIKKN